MPQSVADMFQSIPMSPNLSQSFGRAQEFAREQSHRALLLEHLLMALTEDADAAAVLRACNVDVVRLGTDASGYLGGLLEEMRAAPGTEPTPDAELLRVLEAARQAAQQSRRRVIDGAIVLAAIVGDAKSPAAGLLKAHGMTFEEAIRTLQKASAQARSKQFAPSPGRTQSEPPAGQETEKEPAVAAPERPAAASAAATPASLGQSADEILAAARARIQQRAPSKPETKSPAEAAKKPEPEEPLPLMNLASFNAARSQPPPEPPQQLNGQHGHAAPIGPPPVPPPAGAGPAQLQTAGPPPAPQEPHPSLSPRTLARPNDGGTPPPLRRRGDRPQRSDRLEAPEPPPSRRPAANGALGGQRRPTAEPARPPSKASVQARTAAGQRLPAGPLIEAIPRRMRVGAATAAQVRIGRDKVDSLMQLIVGSRAQYHPEAVLSRALTVRLRAPDGGFAIEPVTPETQWIDAAPGVQQDENVGWRWTVTPQRRGRRRLQLVVAARIFGRDGIAAEGAPPDRTIEVAVRPSLIRRLVRWVIFLVLFGSGLALGRVSQDKLAQDIVDFGVALFKNVLGLLASSGFLGGG